MPVSDFHRCIFIHIPKCAGTSIESVLGMHGAVETVGIEPYLNQKMDDKVLFGKGAQHYSLKKLQDTMPQDKYKSYFKFTFVRNPWERFISHVAWMGGKWHKKEMLTKNEVNEAVRSLMTNKKTNEHLASQVSYIYDNKGQSEIDFIGRFEEIDEHWKRLKTILNIDENLPSRMSSEHKHYSYYLTDSQAEIVGNYYSEDISKFKYKFVRS